MLNIFMSVCSFMIIIIIKYNATAVEISSKHEKRQVMEAKWGDKNFLVVLEFEDNYQCLGALVSSKTLVTSKICLDYYRFSSKISEKPCKVLAGSQETVGKDLGIWRFCLRADKSLWGDDNLDYTKRGISRISFDLPFADMKEASIGYPPFGGSSNCEVHGFSAGKGAQPPAAENKPKNSPGKPEPVPDPSAKFKRHASNHSIKAKSVMNKSGIKIEQSREISHNTSSSNFTTVTPVKTNTKRLPKSSLKKRDEPPKKDGDEAKSYKTLKAKILPMDQCKKLYRENMDVDLPPDEFCVSEGGIKDPGRLLICNDKIVGIVADDLAIKKDNGNIIYAYKFANSNRPILNPNVLWSLVTVHFLYKIFSSPFSENENILFF